MSTRRYPVALTRTELGAVLDALNNAYDPFPDAEPTWHFDLRLKIQDLFHATADLEPL